MKAYNHQITRQSQNYTATKNSFLPLICRASINDVNNNLSLSGSAEIIKDDTTISSFSGDPSSPKVSCIGQIKRNRKLIINPSSSSSATTPPPYTLQSSSATAASSTHITSKTNGQVKYITLKKWFSAKNFTTNTLTSASSAVYGVGESCRSGGKEMMRSYVSSRRSSSKINNDDEGNQLPGGGGGGGHVINRLNFKELDPPLPVVKKAAQPPSEVNLWNRRSGGAVALKGLQIKQIHLHNNNNNNRYQAAPTI